MAERFFFNAFGYLEIPIDIDKITIVDEFEKDITSSLNLPYIGNNLAYVGQNGRYPDIRNNNFTSEEIYKIFYNKNILEYIKKITDDFIVLSTIESFYLEKSNIHRDFCSELKTYKIIFYIDDVSDVNKGPLYVIPGTQNIYDKYSSSIANNVEWPPVWRNNLGAGYCNYSDYLNNNIPKKYFYSNKDKVIIFNNSMLHGSDGNKNEPGLLRRAIAMTVICVDRNNQKLMESVNQLLYNFNVKVKTDSLAYSYCQKNKETCGDWLSHFYDCECITNGDYISDSDYGDKNAGLYSRKIQRMKYYTDFYDTNKDELENETKYNCFINQNINYSL